MAFADAKKGGRIGGGGRYAGVNAFGHPPLHDRLAELEATASMMSGQGTMPQAAKAVPVQPRAGAPAAARPRIRW
jgi:hypothetical protein